MTWTEVYNTLMAAHKIVVVSHPNPDGDAIGSLLGMGNQLRALGKDVTCAVDEGVPEFLQFIPGAETVLPVLEVGAWDVVVYVDAGDLDRAGAVGDYARANAPRIVNIDHHPTNPRFGDVALVVPEAASAAEIICELWERVGLTNYGREVATPLLTGMVTDTMGFRTSSTTARTLELAMKLMQRGASLTEITARALDVMDISELDLWKRVLPRVVVEDQIAYVSISLADANSAGMDDTTDAGLVQFLVRVNQIMVACAIKEKENNELRLSLRSKRGFDVASVAKELGGGGHLQASGATLHMPLAEAEALVLPLLREVVRKGKLEIV
jgi:phosphoesterase RecJ-like protein